MRAAMSAAGATPTSGMQQKWHRPAAPERSDSAAGAIGHGDGDGHGQESGDGDGDGRGMLDFEIPNLDMRNFRNIMRVRE